jgi:hypothetical protein
MRETQPHRHLGGDSVKCWNLDVYNPMGIQGLLQGQLYLLIFIIFVYLNTSFKSITNKLSFHLCACTRGKNVIPRVVAACRWGDESGKLMYPSTFGHVPT